MTPSAKKINKFGIALLSWFETNGRAFRWRSEHASEYELIISELLLQRTRAETVNRFLPHFLRKYRSWDDLSKGSEGSLQTALKPVGLWRRRAVTLKELAAEISRRGGKFPERREAIEALPGVGQYVANAIELFCYGLPRPLLDSSMARVLERYFGERKLADIRYDPYLQALASKVVEIDTPVRMNWAILDLAALVCVSGIPRCEDCPLSSTCRFPKEQDYTKTKGAFTPSA